MNNQPYSTSFDNDTEKAAIFEAAKESARKQAEAREKSRKIFDYYSRRKKSSQKF